MKGDRSSFRGPHTRAGRDGAPWEATTEHKAARSRIRTISVLAGVALSGLGVGVAACQQTSLTETNAPFTDTGPRITGDPAVSAAIEQIPEGTAPFAAPITEMDVTTRGSLPTPVETTCVGGGQDVVLTLKSGRELHFPFCAMPEEIRQIRDAALVRGRTETTGLTK